MEDKNVTAKKSKFNYKALIVLVLIIAVGLSGLLGFTLLNKTIEIKQLKIAEVSAQAKTLKVEQQLLIKTKTLNNCDDELKKLRDRMAGIKTVDDLLKRDIFLYIDKRFQKIPKTISQEIADQVVTQSKEKNVSPELIIGIIQVESAFNPMAISSKNARGLMQVMPEWAKKFDLKKVSDLHDIDTNITSGIKVLRIHIEEAKGNISKGLYRYVGKSDPYAGKVYEAMGKFVAFRSTIDDDKVNIDINGGEDKQKKEEIEKPNATKS